jgi:hypothetical protein
MFHGSIPKLESLMFEWYASSLVALYKAFYMMINPSISVIGKSCKSLTIFLVGKQRPSRSSERARGLGTDQP